MPTPQEIQKLIIAHLEGSLSGEDKERLDAWLNESPINRDAVQSFIEEDKLSPAILEMYQYQEKIWDRLKPAISTGNATVHEIVPLQPNKRVHRAHFLRTKFFRYAAAALLLISIGAYLWNLLNKEKLPQGITARTKPADKADVAPGGQKATLTLVDGSVIVLDSAANGKIASQGNVGVIKKKDGELEYVSEATVKSIVAPAYNTMRTPRGGQYQLILPDGTKVWLNAASSITYPTAFTGKERAIAITGEAYFEVVHNAAMPFRVRANGVNVEVLGTSFNISAYDDEAATNTTLLKGSVKISSGDKGALLQPGQQAQASTQHGLRVLSGVNTDAITAWKNGYFSFQRSDLPAVMRQLARWYDVTVEYRGGMPQGKFGGEISRNANLSQVLSILEESNIRFSIEEKKIIVHP
jgi:transmembrane sensor